MRILSCCSLFLLSWTTANSAPHIPPFDFVEDALREIVNKDSDPCDDFFRHACPLGSPEDLITTSFNKLLDESPTQKDAFWNNLIFIKDSEQLFQDDQVLMTGSEVYLDIFNKTCQNQSQLIIPFFTKLVEIINSLQVASHEEPFLPTNEEISNDDCEKTYDKLKTFFNIFEHRVSSAVLNEKFDDFRRRVNSAKRAAKAISVHLAFDVREGIRQTKKWVEDMVMIGQEWLKETPWAHNYNATEKIDHIVSELNMDDNYGKQYEQITNALFKVETAYMECKTEFGIFENGNLFCLIYTSASVEIHKRLSSFEIMDNAYNRHPLVAFGFHNYYYAQYGNELASKLGYTGFTVGHEIGHTFIDNYYDPHIIPSFSKEAQECITNQYSKTCAEFEEISCASGSRSLDDDGADIFGLQLAYEFFWENYGPDRSTFIDRLGVTNEQLFFYSYAFNFCDGTLQNQTAGTSHSANNVRINVVAQHPGFKRAFGCTDDSRMMKSATDQCVIYGENAPQTRRKLNEHF